MRNDAVTVRKQRLDNAQVCCIIMLPLDCWQPLFSQANRAKPVATACVKGCYMISQLQQLLFTQLASPVSMVHELI